MIATDERDRRLPAEKPFVRAPRLGLAIHPSEALGEWQLFASRRNDSQKTRRLAVGRDADPDSKSIHVRQAVACQPVEQHQHNNSLGDTGLCQCCSPRLKVGTGEASGTRIGFKLRLFNGLLSHNFRMPRFKRNATGSQEVQNPCVSDPACQIQVEFQVRVTFVVEI